MPRGYVPKAEYDNALSMIWRLAKMLLPVPADVRRLVIASRRVAFETQDREAIKELDAASEAFADRVPWDDEPEESMQPATS